jgi:hypothetical protein
MNILKCLSLLHYLNSPLVAAFYTDKDVCFIDSVLLIALLYLAYHLVQRCNTGEGDTDSVFLQEYVNEIPINPLWQ